MLFRQYGIDNCYSHIERLSDINGDGYDDCYMESQPFPNAPANNVRQVIYFGGETFPADSLVVTETTPSATTSSANPLGDVNGDGYNDFSINGWKMYFGGETINLDNYLTFTNVLSQWQWNLWETCQRPNLIHADLNHDGYEDVIGCDTEYGYYDGVITLWMGRASMNGVYDLNLFPTDQHMCSNFGWAKAVADFNNDGIIELAFSTPWWADSFSFADTGYVHIYAANDDLHDTPTQDEVLPIPIIDKWSFSVYPNPLSKSTASLNIKFLGSAYKTAKDIKVEIVNIKGERVVSNAIPSSSLHNGQWHSGRLCVAPGVYIIKVKSSQQTLKAKKIIIK